MLACWPWLARLTPSGQPLTWCGASSEDVFRAGRGRRGAGRRGRPMSTTAGSSHGAWALTGTVRMSQVVVSVVWSRGGLRGIRGASNAFGAPIEWQCPRRLPTAAYEFINGP
eukprot:200878-Chlamydomonas_euryale.AAC.1